MKRCPKLFERINWHGLKREEMNKHFSGGLTFLNAFCVKDEYYPVDVYHVEKPNQAKGHKEFLLLQIIGTTGVVRGMTRQEISEYRWQSAVHCLRCGKILYSVNQHDYKTCGCPNDAMVDGGRAYLRYGAKNLSQIELVRLDLLTGKTRRLPHGARSARRKP